MDVRIGAVMKMNGPVTLFDYLVSKTYPNVVQDLRLSTNARVKFVLSG
jgi:hypothetical protein